MRGLRDRVALVTGSTSGIGAETARRFGEEGSAVVVTGRNGERGAAVVADILRAGGRATFLQADIGDEKSVASLMDEAESAFGSIHILVNNAAPTELMANGKGTTPILEVSTEDVQSMLQIGLYGTFWCSKYCIPKILAGGGGAIVNVTTVASFRGHPSTPIYAMMKGALNSLTLQLAIDYAPEIRVNGVVVGVTAGTPNVDASLASSGQVAAAWRSAAPLPLGNASDVAAAISFLASQDAGATTGSFVFAESGITAKVPLPDLGPLRRYGID